MSKIKQNQTLGIFLLLFLTLAWTACDKAEDFYEDLKMLPEIRTVSYQSAYQVNSVMTIEGRWNPGNLQVKVGSADADIIETSIYENGVREGKTIVHVAKLLITEEMGVGTDRPVTITSNGISIKAPSIEIYKAGEIADSLKLQLHGNISESTLLFHCISGKGSVYMYQDNKMQKLDQNGQTKDLFAYDDLTDEFGSFSIDIMYGGGVDPEEKYLYFSAMTTDNSVDNADNIIFRFCKYDISQSKPYTLNRTLYPKTGTLPEIPVSGKLEGELALVNLMAVRYCYPDQSGNVYLRLMSPKTTDENGYAAALLSATGQLQYLLKSITVNNGSPSNEYRAGISAIPGTGINRLQSMIMADEKKMYTAVRYGFSMGVNTIELAIFDMETRAMLYLYSKSASGDTYPLISGTFSLLTGPYQTNIFGNRPALTGFMPIPGGRVLVLYYQIDEQMKKYYPRLKEFPAYGILDFEKQRGERYAPGWVDMGIFKMEYADVMLNYDEKGMVYSTANNKKYIVKTVKR